ncbi:glycosyltransferase [Burkholderia sp. S171]|uniref:glycosyltransferase n=1 Tax=Burkholderia sp. S171 TaxID=1641860 RepID=UPI00131D7514|nr:glycosyltransferase [Burkholderia sp. S171]
MKVAIVHDWLVTAGSAERVLQSMLECFPQADIFTIVDFLEDRSFLDNRQVTTSFIQKLPFARARYKDYLALMPLAIEQFDLLAYDLVLSSSHAVAKGVLVGPDQLHVSYVHSSLRHARDLQHQNLKKSAFSSSAKSIYARMLLHYIRAWDARSANGVDHLIVNSRSSSRRIHQAYQRESTVIYPPVDVRGLSVGIHKQDFYVTTSSMVPHKHVDLIVEAFSQMPERRLVVIGDGPDMARIKAVAGPNVEILGYQPLDVLHDHVQHARAFVFAAEEDFDTSLVEAQACGTPVIALGKGGALEAVIGLPDERPSGVFFREQTIESLISAVDTFERHSDRFHSIFCRENAERFSAANFKAALSTFVEVRLASFRSEAALSNVQPLSVCQVPQRRPSAGATARLNERGSAAVEDTRLKTRSSRRR